jgi:hypothetical protein
METVKSVVITSADHSGNVTISLEDVWLLKLQIHGMHACLHFSAAL